MVTIQRGGHWPGNGWGKDWTRESRKGSGYGEGASTSLGKARKRPGGLKESLLFPEPKEIIGS